MHINDKKKLKEMFDANKPKEHMPVPEKEKETHRWNFLYLAVVVTLPITTQASLK